MLTTSIIYIVLLVVLCLIDKHHFQLKGPVEWLMSLFYNIINSTIVFVTFLSLDILLKDTGGYVIVIPCIMGFLLIIASTSILTYALKYSLQKTRKV